MGMIDWRRYWPLFDRSAEASLAAADALEGSTHIFYQQLGIDVDNRVHLAEMLWRVYATLHAIETTPELMGEDWAAAGLTPAFQVAFQATIRVLGELLPFVPIEVLDRSLESEDFTIGVADLAGFDWAWLAGRVQPILHGQRLLNSRSADVLAQADQRQAELRDFGERLTMRGSLSFCYLHAVVLLVIRAEAMDLLPDESDDGGGGDEERTELTDLQVVILLFDSMVAHALDILPREFREQYGLF
jgi:hypothetical protein